MTHVELMSTLKKQLPKLNKAEGEILRELVSSIGEKDNSVYRFYEELSTNGVILGLPNIKKVAQNYSVPALYKDLIESRFDKFKMNLKAICQKNADIILAGKEPGFDPAKWTINGGKMFQTTETKTIQNAGGIETICTRIYTVGYFDYLNKLFLEAATETSRLKYSLLLKSDIDMIEYKDGK